MQKRVLMLNASHNDERLICALRELGFYIITTGNRPELPGHKLADEYCFGDYTDIEAMLDLAKRKKVDAVCPCCNDFGVITAAYISEKLGFKGQDSFETTLKIHHKDQFKKLAKQLGLSTPPAESFAGLDEAMDWARANDRYPVIVKPTDLSAGNGIHRADNFKMLENALHSAFACSRVGHVLVEPFIGGTQHGFCTFLMNQKVVAVCSNNEYSFINPYRVEADTFPAEMIESVRNRLIFQVEQIAKALQLSDGIFHLQYKYSNGEAYILECMRRTLGNIYGEPAGGHGAGFNWDYWEARAKCGLGCEGFPASVEERGFWAYRALIAKEKGVFISVSVADDIRPFMYKKHMLHELGYRIETPLSDPVGLLFFKFESAEQMKQIIYERHEEIKVNVVPSNAGGTN